MNLCQCTIRQNGVFDLNKDSQFSLQCSLGVTGRMKHTKVYIIHLELASQPKTNKQTQNKTKNPNNLKTISIIFSDMPGCVGCTVVFHVCGKVLFLPRQAGTEERCGYVGTYADFSDF